MHYTGAECDIAVLAGQLAELSQSPEKIEGQITLAFWQQSECVPDILSRARTGRVSLRRCCSCKRPRHAAGHFPCMLAASATHSRSCLRRRRATHFTLQRFLESWPGSWQSCRRARRKLQGRLPWRAGRTVNVLPDIPSRARGACIFSHVLQLHVSRTCCVAASEMRCQELPYSSSRKSAWLLGFKAEAHTAVVSSQRYGRMTMSLYGRKTTETLPQSPPGKTRRQNSAHLKPASLQNLLAPHRQRLATCQSMHHTVGAIAC